MNKARHTTARTRALLEANDNLTARRRRLERVIEIAIGLLDTLDGDENLEETGDLEPYLGWVAGGPGRCCNDEDREAEDEHGGNIDDEPHDDDELDHCDGLFDVPGFIPGGNEGVRP